MSAREREELRAAHWLIVGSDPELERELRAALDSVRGAPPVLHFVRERRRGLEAIRARRPDVVLVEADSDIESLCRFAEEATRDVPETFIAGVYHRDVFGSEASESTALIRGLRSRISDFLRRPVSSADLDQLLRRIDSPRQAAPKPRGHLISFLSNKGGVGKSTLSLNVACALARRHPGRVLLVDASLQLGLAAPMLDLRPKTTLVDAVREKERLDETLLHQLTVRHSGGLRLLAAPKDPRDAAAIDDESISRVLTLARRTFDYVIVDTFPMIDAVVVAILDISDRAYLVVQDTAPVVVGSARLQTVLEELGFERSRTRIVVNRNLPRFTGRLRPGEIEERLGREIDHLVPYSRGVLVALNTGRPFVLHDRKPWGFGKAVRAIAKEIERELPPMGVVPAAVTEREEADDALEARLDETPIEEIRR